VSRLPSGRSICVHSEIFPFGSTFCSFFYEESLHPEMSAELHLHHPELAKQGEYNKSAWTWGRKK
jgi:hypothetical protein